MKQPLNIDQLWIYPVKSCAGIEVNNLRIDEQGPVDDRRWMIVDEHGRFISQRTHPIMATILPTLTEDGLTLSAQGSEVCIPQHQRGAPLEVEVWSDQLTAQRTTAEADRWLSALLKQPVSLVRQALVHQRRVDEGYDVLGESAVVFADGFPLLLTHQGSLQALNAWLRAKGESACGMERFRPNIVVSGGGAFEEDQWRTLETARGGKLLCVKPCSRCVMINVDQQQGQSSPHQEPLRTLSEHRSFKRPAPKRGAHVLFGQNLLSQGIDQLSVGETLFVTARATSLEID